jgi:hypothetical protein
VAGVLALGLLAVPSICAAATFTVTNTAESGPGSLRQAISSANATPNVDANTPDLIDCAVFPGTPPFTIQPQTALPTITELVKIDEASTPLRLSAQEGICWAKVWSPLLAAGR